LPATTNQSELGQKQRVRAAIRSGLPIAADDLLLATAGADGFTIFGVPSACRLSLPLTKGKTVCVVLALDADRDPV
jgi:hypothetical protein